MRGNTVNRDHHAWRTRALPSSDTTTIDKLLSTGTRLFFLFCSPTSSIPRNNRRPCLCPFESRNRPPKKGMNRLGNEIADISDPYLVALNSSFGSFGQSSGVFCFQYTKRTRAHTHRDATQRNEGGEIAVQTQHGEPSNRVVERARIAMIWGLTVPLIFHSVIQPSRRAGGATATVLVWAPDRRPARRRLGFP